jgi:hypothetical protein
MEEQEVGGIATMQLLCVSVFTHVLVYRGIFICALLSMPTCGTWFHPQGCDSNLCFCSFSGNYRQRIHTLILHISRSSGATILFPVFSFISFMQPAAVSDGWYVKSTPFAGNIVSI